MTEVAKWIGGVVAFFSLLVASISLRQNLERERRALAVRLIYDWAGDTDWATSRAVAIATELGKEEVGAINRKEKVSIHAQHYDSITSILETNFPKESLPSRPGGSDEKFEITKEQSVFIRFLWLRWLNRLEGTLAAWLKGAADLQLMKREFEPLVRGSSKELEALEVVREDLPVIAEFYRQLKEEGKIKVTPPLGIFPWSGVSLTRGR